MAGWPSNLVTALVALAAAGHPVEVGAKQRKTAFGKLAAMKEGLHVRSVLVPVADGVEEMELITIVDVLRRAGLRVTVASIEKSTKISCLYQSTIVADTLCELQVSSFLRALALLHMPS